MFKKNLLAAVAIAVALPTLAVAGDKPLTKSATVEVKATVVAVDLKTRDVTAGGVGVIRCTVMDPFLATRRGKTDYLADFVVTMKRQLDAALAALLARDHLVQR